ncbi:hypothetical protein Ancab_026225 [Ancistrocladus abbreviatus]
MLQRAASNAYSWWWASHIRTKQSKWLEQSLQDMGEKVASVLKLIEEDGDSFAKRAEMYYKKRPELINFVEETYRAYRALAERYDHISKELQNANSTLASAFPDQFQFAMDDDDDDESVSPRMQMRPPPPAAPSPNIPKAPKFPAKSIKAIMALTNLKKKSPPKTAPKSATNAPAVPKSGLSKSEALEEIDKLQKNILTKQTEKEFTKSSYETGLAKYWQIEEEIAKMQDKISKLQDEFGIGKVIEDEEARTLMAEAALKSCQETLLQLEEKYEKAAVGARAEQQRIKDAHDKLSSLRGWLQSEPSGSKDDSFAAEENRLRSKEGEGSLGEQTEEPENCRDKIKKHFDVEGNTSLTVSEMAEKIDELVNKVMNLETAVSSQTALIEGLRSETDDLHAQIQSLEGDKADLIDSRNTLNKQLVEMENKLKELQNLDQSAKNWDISISTHFTEEKSKPYEEVEESQGAGSCVEFKSRGSRKEDGRDKGSNAGISIPSPEVTKGEKKAGVEMDKKEQKPLGIEKLDPKPVQMDKKDPEAVQIEKKNPEPVQKTVELPNTKKHEQNSPQGTQTDENSNKKEDELTISYVEQSPKKEKQHTPHSTQPEGNTSTKDEPNTPNDNQPHIDTSQQAAEANIASATEQAREQEGEPNWQQMFINGLEGKEKVLLAEYTSVLRNYKEMKKKLSEVEKSRDDLLELAAQLKELKGANAMKDEEIQSLRQKMGILQKRLEECKNMKEIKEVELDARNTPPEKDDEDIKAIIVDQPRELSPAEEKLRGYIDEILEENLDFWLRFSTSFHQIQKFQTSVEDLQKDLAKLEDNEKKRKEGGSSSHSDPTLKSEARATYKHLGEKQTELTVWLEQSVQLKDELQRRFSQLCHLQEEITRALNDGAEADDMKFTSFQAAKFQGEVLNMQQENNKVADELQAGMDHVTNLQLEVERTLARMNEELGFSASRSESDGEMTHSGSRNRVPLRSFIFGVKPKKQKPSILSCMHPALHRKYQQLKTGDSL